jgi:hypothetical protein
MMNFIRYVMKHKKTGKVFECAAGTENGALDILRSTLDEDDRLLRMMHEGDHLGIQTYYKYAPEVRAKLREEYEVEKGTTAAFSKKRLKKEKS